MKLPEGRSKYNEPYHKGLYKFQPETIKVEIGTAGEPDEYGQDRGSQTGAVDGKMTSTMGRWTLDEHKKFLKGKFQCLKSFLCSSKTLRERLDKSRKVHKNTLKYSNKKSCSKVFLVG